MDYFRKNLRNILRKVDGEISIYDLAKKLNLRVDPMLEKILLIQQEYKALYQEKTNDMTVADTDFMQQFFKIELIDLGFLVQHRIKEIASSLRKKHNTMGHQMFYDAWLLYRGY